MFSIQERLTLCGHIAHWELEGARVYEGDVFIICSAMSSSHSSRQGGLIMQEQLRAAR